MVAYIISNKGEVGHFARYMMGKCRHEGFGEQNLRRGAEQNDHMTSEEERGIG